MHQRSGGRICGSAAARASVVLVGALLPLVAGTASHAARPLRSGGASSWATAPLARTPFPDGIYDPAEPSRMAPPGPYALHGYRRAYVNDFNRWLSPSMWFRFSGVPLGDPAGYFAPSHVTLNGGRLIVSTYQDPARGGAWVSGGAGLYGVHPTYGAFFVRSRQTAPGADTAELLWPKDNQWPPEIDFNETGVSPSSSSWTVHFTNAVDKDEHTDWSVNVQHWHTWGVIWTRSAITFTLDGRQWGPRVTAPAEIPHLPMALDLQQQSWCGYQPECPTTPSSLLVDWVDVYLPG